MLLGTGNASEDTSMCCQGVMGSQGFVLQKVGPEAVQVIQEGQGFFCCIKANSPIGSMFKCFTQNSWVSPGETVDDLKNL